jgi:hypothetical protein
MERLIGTNSTNNEGERYIRELNEFCEYHRINEKVDRLYQATILGLQHRTLDDKEIIITALNKLDTLITQGMLASEKHNCKLKPKTLVWSPTLSNSHFVIEFWNIVKKSYDQQLDASERIQHILTRLPDDIIQEIQNNDLDYEEAVQQAIQVHENNLRNHYTLRKQYLGNMVEDLNARSETNNSNTVKGIIRREES